MLGLGLRTTGWFLWQTRFLSTATVFPYTKLVFNPRPVSYLPQTLRPGTAVRSFDIEENYDEGGPAPSLTDTDGETGPKTRCV